MSVIMSTVFPTFIVNQRTITSDLSDLHTTIQDIRSACQKMPATAEDRFAVVMGVSFTKVRFPSEQRVVDDEIMKQMRALDSEMCRTFWRTVTLPSSLWSPCSREQWRNLAELLLTLEKTAKPPTRRPSLESLQSS